MASSIDYLAGRELLNTHLIKLEELSIDKDSINFPEAIQESLKIVPKGDIAFLEWDLVGEKVNKLSTPIMARLQEVLTELKSSSFKAVVLISVVNGVLFARRLRDIRGVVGAACVGDGATSTGSFHEAINQAAVERLPLVLIVANNLFAYSTPTTRQFACRNLVDKAAGYGVEGHTLDATDLAACLKVVAEAVRLAREGRGAQLVVGRLLRLCGHGEHDIADYVDAKLKQSAVGRDCLKVAEEHLLQRGWADARTAELWRNEATQKVEEAVATVQREPTPDPYKEDWRALSSLRLVEAREGPPI